MPNGVDKNWFRLLGTLNGFHTEFGHWPKWVRLDPMSLEDLREFILGPKAFEAVNEKVTLIPDESEFPPALCTSRSWKGSWAQISRPFPMPTAPVMNTDRVSN